MNSVGISLSASALTSATAKEAVEAGQARLRAAGLDIEWRRIVEERPIAGSLGGFEGGAHVDGTLQLYDTPGTAEAKFKAARSVLDRSEYP